MGPGITHISETNLMEQCLKIYLRNARTDIYSIMCSIDAHEKQQTLYAYCGISIGSKEIPLNLTTEALDSLGATFDSVDCWIKLFDQNYQDQ